MVLFFLTSRKSAAGPKSQAFEVSNEEAQVSIYIYIYICIYIYLHKNICICMYIHPKTLFEIAMVLSTNRGSFPSNSHVSATFSILLRFGESWNPTNCERFNVDGSLMGRTNLDKYVR